ncbi:hypothetical protein [Pedobacter cryoconitis]|uniref:Uncharacterized protein n=1 Tax=Pedobacter cryoconitis TaxID=188932 RepID=A0A7X0J1R1_9SPHI|nr:hypothetical protein [Pedobacter cryoconitis]MBB6499438.1 hypothetical protein [Pedobacter cryoconitis]
MSPKNITASFFLLATLFLVSFRPVENPANKPDDCYRYLTELVRSSNFPLKGFDRKKVNLLIDEDSTDSLRLKLFFDTEGTGTLGWVMYYPKERKLTNITVDPEAPVVLTFNQHFAEAYEKCKGITVTGTRAGKKTH